MIDPYRVPLTNRLTVPKMFMSCCIKSENVFCFVFLTQRFKFFHLAESPARRVKGFCFHRVVFWSKKTFPVLMTYTRVGWGVLFNSSDSYNLCLSSVLSGFGTLWLLAGEPQNQLQNWDFWQLLHVRKQISSFLSLTHPWQPSYGWWISIKQNRRDPTKRYKNCTCLIFSDLMVLLFCTLAVSPTGHLKG